jgi:predicted amidohydrolase
MTDALQPLVKNLCIGLIQTTLNHEMAWKKGDEPRMSVGEDNRAWHEIRRSMRALADHDEQPRVLLLPELSLPLTRLNDFEAMVCARNALAIVGVDYQLNPSTHEVRNQGVVVVPRNLFKGYPSRYASRVLFGKNIPAPSEEKDLKKYGQPWSFAGDSNVYVFDAGPFGRFGVSICYDFMDLERALMYRGRVHHLVVLAYNRDIKLFESLAVSLSRTVFCNVIVCNAGYFGGSLVVTPFHEAPLRIRYEVQGNNIFSAQCVTVPVQALDDALHGKKVIAENGDSPLFKQSPPGFSVDF